MSNNLDKINIIKKDMLNSEFYFQSLIEQAHAKGLLRDSDIERLQYECLNLIAYKTERYNSGDSSSIKIEEAQDIMTSNLFTIGVWLKTYYNPDDAVSELINVSINDIYQKGRTRIDTLISNTKVFHKKLLNQIVDIKNIFYRSTIEDAINGFFKLYDPEFAAHEIHITADYPVFNHMPKLTGIEFIEEYLNALYYENLFCSYFDLNDIHYLLCGYEGDYQELLINIYEHVLTAAIGCVIVEKDVYRLNITEDGVECLCKLFTDISRDNILQVLLQSVYKLENKLLFPKELGEYIKNSLPNIVGKIHFQAQHKMLNKVFFTPVSPKENIKIAFSFGNRMDNDKYRKIVEEIIQCRFTEDKLDIINESIHTLSDLEDILLDAHLEQEEIESVLCNLSLPEIAALSKKYTPQYGIDLYDIREKEEILRNCLNKIITNFPQDKQNAINNIIEAIEE